MMILNYHELVDDTPPSSWSLTRITFDAHLALYNDKLISPQTFLDRCRDPAAAKSDAVLLTFDDGFLSDYTDVYAGHMIAGRVPGFMSFIPMDFVGKPGHMTWEMIQEMDKNGVTIGSHGMAHVDLTSLSDSDLYRELAISKLLLEDRLGRSVPLFAFPYGRFSKRVWDTALRAEYTHLFTIQLGHHRGFEPFLYSRLCMTNDMDTAYMHRHLHNPDATRGTAWNFSNRLGLYRQMMRFRYR